ncbi:cytochrome c oxidase assembly protein [Micromonospora sp. WMMD1102]|uniref:cytochrome c oxidase assembly protein n=1 Tax=Micromonospora sp. WMMD1102 TaxID=3016105 RepID=UPI002414D98F|nr:cytochrome c oxidase assembly protein [Micromonospora sp. WMMD1102]MDG4789770.1 cytochrome c oxidase assembly protein [Micromonospora sp. WMMD1102]
MTEHDHPHPVPDAGAGGLLGLLLPALGLLLCAAGYLYLAGRVRRGNPARGWSRWRTASFGVGLLLLAMALLPPLASFAHTDFRGHMLGHLLVGMYAPLALVLGAPVTLLLRTLPARHGRRLVAVLHARPARLLTRPAVAWLLSTGSLVVLYFTPLFDTLAGRPAGHWLLHAHFLLAGCLFAHVVAGPDPAPARPGVPARLVWLGCAIALHAVVSQLMYAGYWVRIAAPAAEVRTAAEIMYYGGDIAELLLAAALVATWRPERRSADRRRRAVPEAASTGALSPR